MDSMGSEYNWTSSEFHIGILVSLRHPFPKAHWRVVWNKCMKFVVRQSGVQVLPYEFCDLGKVLKLSKPQFPPL